MAVNYIMEAFLDNYGTINVYVNSRFYGGNIDKFYLKDNSGKKYHCLITRIDKSKDFNRYKLSLPLPYDFSKGHKIVCSYGFQTDLIVRNIVNQNMFKETFAYNKDDLGPKYTKEYTDFAVWAPTASSVTLNYIIEGVRHLEYMDRTEKGVFRKRIEGDLDGVLYAYMSSINGVYRRTSDPYAYSGINNDSYSAVINLDSLVPLVDYDLPVMRSYNDAIIYEMSVQDFTNDPKTNTNTHSKYVSLTEEGTFYEGLPTGLEYIKDLGVTHVQLMPVFDFATVDEDFPDDNYNWGYDPLNYGIIEGSYSKDHNDPYSRMNEFREMVNSFHKNGIRVVCDVVFNHHYDMGRCNLESLVPHYSFRYTDDGFLSNGSFCGNDIESRNYMVRKYILTLCRRFVEVYGIDGLRFDLMGIIDIDTINMIYEECSAIKKDFMLYGEGWNMPTAMDDSEKASQDNAEKMPEIAFFNDGFRDIMKGGSSEHEAYSKGYVTGKIDLIPYAKSVMQGDCINSKYLSSSQSVNYAACHDNLTSYDKISACCYSDTEETKVAKQKLLLACTMFAQGIPFFHSGQEFCRTKNGLHNTYNSSAIINRIDWRRRNRYQGVVEFFKDLVEFRKTHDELKYITPEEIKKHVSFEEIYGTLVYIVDDLRIYINPTLDTMTQCLTDYHQIVFDGEGSVENGLITKDVKIPGFSILVVQKVDKKD